MDASDPSAPVDVQHLADALRGEPPIAIVDAALTLQGRDAAIGFSGSEDVLLIELAHQTGRPYRVFSLDTGRLHPETYRFFERVQSHYGIKIEYGFPDTVRVESLVRTKGMFSFLQDGHAECCGIRKVEPLVRQLASLRGWITGQRRDQSPATRAGVPAVEIDPAHRGLGGAPLYKWNPLADRTSADVWDAIRAFDVPYNALHERGFVSIGCEPCTRAITPGQHERDGRWWWESADNKECGLHVPGSAAGE